MATADSGNLGALTTTFVPPTTLTECATTFMGSNPTGSWLQQGFFNEEDEASCLPSLWQFGGDKYFSPGICPSGYTVACQNTIDGSITGTCCPYGYSCKAITAPYAKNLCQATIVSESSKSIVSVNYNDETSQGIIQYEFTSGDKVDAHGVIVRRQDGDPTWADSLAPSTDSPDTGTASLSSSSSTGSSSLATSSSLSSGPTALSSNAKTGIGLGVSFGVLLLLGMIFAAYKVGTKRRRGEDNNTSDGESKNRRDDDVSRFSKAPIVVDDESNRSGSDGGGAIGGVEGRHEMHVERSRVELMPTTEGYYPIEMDGR